MAENTSATFAQWQALRDPDSPSITFADGIGFLTQHPGWPQEKIIRIRTEAAALAERPGKAAMQAFCAGDGPITGRGMVACVNAEAGDATAREKWVQRGWLQGDFSADEEAAILVRYGQLLTQTRHRARLERLLFENKASAAKRMFALVPAGDRAVAEACMALASDERGAERHVKKLSAAQLHSPALVFARIGWRIRHHQEDQLGELFAAAPKSVPYPDAWWPARALAAREALSAHRPQVALTLLAGHGDLKPEFLADALFLKGWITLRHRGDAATAYRDFYRLYTSVETPVSKARAAYWAGRAAVKNGNPDIARQWMEKAARHPSVFYGQLAAQFLDPKARPLLPDAPRLSASEKKAFEDEELVAITRALAQNGDTRLRDVFLAHLSTQAANPARAALVANLAQEVDGLPARVRAAKAALRLGLVLAEDGWPVIPVPPGLPIEPALTLAIARQESEFDATARSSADARGLMQLLPATARHVADRNLLPYGNDTLDNPAENLRLGSLYLGQIINGFDGSYVLGIASYNAGPANVRKWVAASGNPPLNAEGAIDWIESIPFAETRNYVMRVLENLQVYRVRLDVESTPPLKADLTRRSVAAAGR
ncbi:MAG: transglycosylase SLT domain-containing protein [Rickettsiales bacterium]